LFGNAGPAQNVPEETIWSGRYSARAAALQWLLCVVWLVALAVVYFLFVPRHGYRTGLFFLGAGLLPALWVSGKVLLRKLSLRYRLSNHRFFVERGLFSRHLDELELIRVDDVSVSQDFVQRLFDVGTVTVVSTDATNPRLPIEGILGPVDLKEAIRTQVRARRARTTFLENL
jgi:uncharacterized membrane protein YdbT with pleckstrin-like domain